MILVYCEECAESHKLPKLISKERTHWFDRCGFCHRTVYCYHVEKQIAENWKGTQVEVRRSGVIAE